MTRAADAKTANHASHNTASAITHRMHPMTLGTLLAVVSAVAYMAANIALREVARAEDSDWAVWVSCIKAVPAALAAWGLIGYRALRGLPAMPPRRLILPLLLTGLFMQFGGNVAFQWALGVGGLALTVPLNFATLILSAAWLGRVFLGEVISRRSARAMAVLFLSIVFLSAGAQSAAWSVSTNTSRLSIVGAILAAALAGVAYGACGVVIRGVVTRDVSLSATLVMLSTSGVVGLGAMSLWRVGVEGLLQTPTGDFQMMLLAGTLNAVAFFALSAALKHISVLRTNLINASQMAMAAVAGVVWFEEALTSWLIAGTILTMLGLCLIEGRPTQPSE